MSPAAGAAVAIGYGQPAGRATRAERYCQQRANVGEYEAPPGGAVPDQALDRPAAEDATFSRERDAALRAAVGMQSAQTVAALGTDRPPARQAVARADLAPGEESWSKQDVPPKANVHHDVDSPVRRIERLERADHDCRSG